MVVEFEYNLTEKDYINFNIFHVRNSKVAKRSLMIQRIVGPLLFLVFGYLYYQTEEVSLIGLITTFIILSVLWVMFYPMYFNNYIIRNTKKMIKEGNNNNLLGSHRMVMSENGIVDSTMTGQTSVQWSGINQFKEDKHNFYLYNSSVSAYILPKRELQNVEEVRKYIESNLIL